MKSASKPLAVLALLALIPVGTLFMSGAIGAQERAALPDYVIEAFGQPPAIPEGPLSDTVQDAVDVAFVDATRQFAWRDEQTAALEIIQASGDPRLAWVVSDLMRFSPSPGLNAVLSETASTLLGIEPDPNNHWGVITDHLIAWDIPAPPDYLRVKRAIFTSIVPGWDKIFVEGDIDWRLVSWGGVLIDDRVYDATDRPCNCIPAADNPEVSTAEEANTGPIPAALWKCGRWSTIRWAVVTLVFPIAPCVARLRPITPTTYLTGWNGPYCAHPVC